MKWPRSLEKANESRQVHQPPWIFCSRQSAITCNKGPRVSLSTVLQKWKIHTKNYEGDWIWVAKIMEKGNHNEAWYFASHFVSKHLLVTRGQEGGIRWGPEDYTGFSTTSQCWEGKKMWGRVSIKEEVAWLTAQAFKWNYWLLKLNSRIKLTNTIARIKSSQTLVGQRWFDPRLTNS